MCLNPSIIKTKSRYLSFLNHSRLLNVIPCGKCSECKERKRSDYEIRAIVESLDTKRKGGFVYMDTLTYAPSNRPVFNGIQCFSKDDCRKFFKRLHITLKRKGYDLTYERNGKFHNRLHHFLVCEYGERRNAPHYHVIFFSTVPNLKPFELWKIVRETWQKGFNNHPNEWYKYIVHNERNAVNYCCKYVNKDSHLSEKINIEHTKYIVLLDELYKKGYNDDDKNVQNVKAVLDVYDDTDAYKSVYPFNMISNGFGENLFEHFDYETFIKDGFISVVNGLKTYKYCLPMYNMRKTFFDCIKDYNYPNPDTLEPTIRYIPNDEYVRFRQLHIEDDISRFIEKLDKKTQEIKQVYSPSISKRYEDTLSSLLSQVNIRDYAIYEVFQKNSLFGFSINPYDIVYKQSQVFTSGEPLYTLSEDKCIHLYDESCDPTCIKFDDLYKLTIDYEDKNIDVYHQITALVDTYYRKISKSKNSRYFINEELNFKFKNG